MAGQWVKEGLQVMADAVVKTAATPEILEIFLFSDNETITDSTVNADLTEILANGCIKQDLTKATWASATDADPVVSVYNSGTGVSWSVSGTQIVYGWAIRGKTSTKIYAAENWALKTFGNGDTITIEPLTLSFDIPE